MGTSGRVRSLTTAAVGCSKHRFREAVVKGQEFDTFHWQLSEYYTGNSHMWRGLMSWYLVKGGTAMPPPDPKHDFVQP
jgi:hypothetical protein